MTQIKLKKSRQHKAHLPVSSMNFASVSESLSFFISLSCKLRVTCLFDEILILFQFPFELQVKYINLRFILAHIVLEIGLLNLTIRLGPKAVLMRHLIKKFS